MEWLTAHLGAKEIGISAGALLLLLLLARKRLFSFLQFLWAANKTLRETESELTAAAERRELEAKKRCQELEHEKSELKSENQQLANDLKEETRKVLVREQINAEDTVYIRALTVRLRRAGVDYSDINAEFSRTE